MIPEIGKEYHFFDDGKLSLSRHFIATVVDVFRFDDPKCLLYKNSLGESLYERIQKEQKECDFLYRQETDYVVAALIKEYDKDLVFFIRTIDSGWFSIDFTNWWQAGRLDVEEILYKKLTQYEIEKEQEQENNQAGK